MQSVLNKQFTLHKNHVMNVGHRFANSGVHPGDGDFFDYFLLYDERGAPWDGEIVEPEDLKKYYADHRGCTNAYFQGEEQDRLMPSRGSGCRHDGS